MFIANKGVIYCGYLGYNDNRLFFEGSFFYIGICDSHTRSFQIGSKGKYQKVTFVYLSKNKDRPPLELSEIRIGHLYVVDTPYHFE